MVDLGKTEVCSVNMYWKMLVNFCVMNLKSEPASKLMLSVSSRNAKDEVRSFPEKLGRWINS